jgi:FkbH-like protein
MRATVVGEAKLGSIDLEPSIISELRRTREAIGSRSLLVWGEHCTECAMPSCFATCSLYTPRTDLKCRRLDRGIEGLVANSKTGPRVKLTSVAFRHWGKLEAQGTARLVPSGAAELVETLESPSAQLVDQPWLTLWTRRKLTRVLDRSRNAFVNLLARDERADFFLLEAINASDVTVKLTLTVKPASAESPGLYQECVTIAKGYNRLFFPTDPIFSKLGTDDTFLIQLEPLDPNAYMQQILFGIIDFVNLKTGEQIQSTQQDAHAYRLSIEEPNEVPIEPAIFINTKRETLASSKPKVKCVVWDLDNVMWSGTLIEDGLDGVRLDPRVVAIIVELDRRGILNSIASKNSSDEALRLLDRFGLKNYFLYPEIHWNPKSQSIQAISSSLNIGRDTLLFIDDQAFERTEVQHAHPEVEVFDVDFLENMLDDHRFQVPVTDESLRRRSMYQDEQVRHRAVAESGADYNAFLKSCGITLTICQLDDTTLARAFELTERTNQLNYSGRRLSRPELEVLSRAEGYNTLILSASDKFGDYGIIGLALLNNDTWTVECFFMSCRVQRKKVEHAFFGRLLEEGTLRGKPCLSIIYKRTQKNEPSRVVIEDEMGFRSHGHEKEERTFFLEAGEVIPDSDLVTFVDHSNLGLAPALT